MLGNPNISGMETVYQSVRYFWKSVRRQGWVIPPQEKRKERKRRNNPAATCSLLFIPAKNIR
jgi:hypothetical protein